MHALTSKIATAIKNNVPPDELAMTLTIDELALIAVSYSLFAYAVKRALKEED